MSRERITERALKAADPSFGQSANNYWRNRAKEVLRGALSELEKELMNQAQKVTNEEAREVGVEPAQYAGGEVAPVVVPVEESVAIEKSAEKSPKEASEAPAEETPAEESEEEPKMAMVFEPRNKNAGAPVDPSAIGKENWFNLQEKFPQYTKQQKLTMLAVAPTRRNMEAVHAVTETLDGIATQLEESGNEEAATQLDVISDLVTASINECKRIATESKK